ncbi:MAG: RecX family transcriptional regulator [Alphaproteobacteria bacterium]|nr:RecX family transcriptional regulator [Alphaproteobacteria bacterium]MBP9867858.1 RecX family transcriptional regulator [Alphaproteobacteria bacterium]
MRNTVDPEKSSPRSRPPVKKITATYLENSGKFYLERFPASTAQFRRVMTRKIDRSCRAHADQDREECLNLLETLISRFQTIGFLDDPAYASGLRYSLTQRGYSSSRIAQTLRQKGISPDWLQEASAREPLNPDHDWLAALRWIKKKRLGAYSTRDEGPNRSLASLARAGFEFDMARKALSLTVEETEEHLLSNIRTEPAL